MPGLCRFVIRGFYRSTKGLKKLFLVVSGFEFESERVRYTPASWLQHILHNKEIDGFLKAFSVQCQKCITNIWIVKTLDPSPSLHTTTTCWFNWGFFEKKQRSVVSYSMKLQSRFVMEMLCMEIELRFQVGGT